MSDLSISSSSSDEIVAGVNPFTYGLNYSLIDYDYAENVDEIDENITKNPLISIVINKLNKRYKNIIKKEELNDYIKNDFFDFKNKKDEFLKYLNEIVFNVNLLNMYDDEFFDDEVINDIKKIEDNVSDLNKYITEIEDKPREKIINDLVNQINKDIDIDIDQTVINTAKLKNYQSKLAKEYLELRKNIREKLSNISAKVKSLKEISNIFEFDEDDLNVFNSIINKYISKEDIKGLINKYIPIKIKLFCLLAFSRWSVNKTDCKICLADDVRLYAIRGCGHVFCDTCIHEMDRCALCRIPIDERIKLYL